MKVKHFSALLFLGVFLTQATTIIAQCPEIKINEKYTTQIHDIYNINHWDTAVDCNNPGINLSVDATLTTQNFNGTYLVEEIPYNPPEPFTFGTRMPLSTDDDFAPSSINISFPFLFFGIQKDVVTLGANGMATFTPGAANQSCPWSYSAGIPWTGSNGGPSTLTYMRDAIYGVYEDTYPYQLGNSARGIYYGSSPQSDYPCRHICFSWNRVPQFNKHSGSDSATYNCTYQIVIYEGTNIVEVHVKQRKANPSWQSGIGVIGIQNATGQTQVSTFNNRNGSYTDYIMPNSPAAFAPTGFNPFYTDITERAWRFTPQGQTNKNIQFYRLFDNGDSLELASNPNSQQAIDAAGYYTNEDRTSCHINPTVTSRYMVTCRYITRTGILYYLKDIITVGADTSTAMALTVNGTTTHSATICSGDDIRAHLTHPDELTLDSCGWSAKLLCNGRDSILSDTCFEVLNNGLDCRLKRLTAFHRFGVDTINMICAARFANGCSNYDSLIVYVHPNTCDTTVGAICNGKKYTFLDEDFYNATEKDFHLTSHFGCDSVKHLSLHVSQTSHTYDSINDCMPIVWKNNRTYYSSNTTSTNFDTIVLQNMYGCDSIVQLVFTLFPLHADLLATPSNADMDHMTIQLTDISSNDSTRDWNVEGVGRSSDHIYSFGYPINHDSITVHLKATSKYGCEDDTSIVVHLLKESIYVPNAFTPMGLMNNKFKVQGEGLTYLEIYIYSRTGQRIYTHTGLDAEWDGRTVDGKMCPQGTYTYLIRYRNLIDPNRTYLKKGTITLIK